MRPERVARVLVGLLLLLLILGPIFANGVDLLVNWLWFNQEGFRVIYTTTLKSQIALSGYTAFGFMAIVALNIWIARRLAHRAGYRVYHDVIELPGLDRFSSIFRWVIWIGVFVIGFFVGEWATGHWLEYLFALRPVHMGQADPLFGIDLSFYMFRLPFVWFLYHLAVFTLVVCLLTAVFVYLMEGGVTVTARGPIVSRITRTHLIVLGGLFFVLMAYRCRLAMYDLLYSPRGTLYGAGYADIAATLPVLKILAGALPFDGGGAGA